MSGKIQPRYSPRFNVTVDGKKYQEPGGRIADLVVETTIDGADRFSFTLNYPFDEELGEFSGLDWSAFEIGKPVEIAMGYGGDGTLTPLLTGKIASIQSAFALGNGPSVSVSGYGLLRETMKGTSSDSWADERIGTAVEDVLSSYSFSNVRVSDADTKRVKLIQDNQSDFRFVQELAENYGFEFSAERDEVSFTPRNSRGDDPVAELWYGEALHEFHAEIKQTQQEHSVEVRSWDVQNKEEIVATAGSRNADHTEVFRVPVMSKQEAKRLAKKKHSQFADGIIEGHGEADGTPEIRAGETIHLAEMGEKFSGDYYVTQATHRMGGSGYRTSFEVTEVSS